MTATTKKRSTAGKRKKLRIGLQEHHVGQNIWELYNAYVQFLTAKAHSQIMSLNLTQWRTLTFIRYNSDQTQSALSKAVGIDPSSMTPIIDLFERKRWVRRTKSRENRSAYEISMTPTGVKAYNKTHIHINKTEKLIRDVLGEQDTVRFNEMLVRVREGLTSDQ